MDILTLASVRCFFLNDFFQHSAYIPERMQWCNRMHIHFRCFGFCPEANDLNPVLCISLIGTSGFAEVIAHGSTGIPDSWPVYGLGPVNMSQRDIIKGIQYGGIQLTNTANTALGSAHDWLLGSGTHKLVRQEYISFTGIQLLTLQKHLRCHGIIGRYVFLEHLCNLCREKVGQHIKMHRPKCILQCDFLEFRMKLSGNIQPLIADERLQIFNSFRGIMIPGNHQYRDISLTQTCKKFTAQTAGFC